MFSLNKYVSTMQRRIGALPILVAQELTACRGEDWREAKEDGSGHGEGVSPDFYGAGKTTFRLCAAKMIGPKRDCCNLGNPSAKWKSSIRF